MSSKSARDDSDIDGLRRELKRYVPDALMRRLAQLLDALASRGIESDGDDLPPARRAWAAERDLGAFGASRGRAGAEFGASDSIAFDAHPGSAQGMRAFRQALAATAPVLGENADLAFDSADALFRAAIGVLGGRDARYLHTSALAPMFSTLMHARNQQAAATGGGELRRGDRGFALHAERANNDAGFARRFPSAAAVKTLG